MSGADLRAAVDVGGTFTDIQLLDAERGRTWAYKTATTPDNPGRGIVDGLTAATARNGLSMRDIGVLMHGTTIATNAVLERKLARGALLTTAGFEDVLEIGRHVRADIYSAIAEPRNLLISRQLRFGVRERMRADGTAEHALTDAEAERIAALLAHTEVDALAICLLHAYANPTHEQRLVEALAKRLPALHICASHQISPELREFERTSTTALNALLMPVVGNYLNMLEQSLREAGMRAPLYLFQSNGGVLSAAQAASAPVRLLLSGPAGGALAVKTLGQMTATPNLVGMDMGGTSFDVCVVEEGRTREVNQSEVAGAPVRVPMTEIRTISAGGGSIARVDDGGRARVGPDSAGARPGPAAYGHGGTQATVTDANVVLGRLSPDAFLDGDMSLDAAAAAEVVRGRVGDALGVSAEQAASGILRVAVSQMANAIRLSLFEKGLDPRDFALLSFGGAGGLHAAEVAEELGATRVLYPAEAATLSAWGMLFADVTQDHAATRLLPATAGRAAELDALVLPLARQARQTLTDEGFDDSNMRLEVWADMRYPGQAYEIAVPWGELQASSLADADAQQALVDAARITRAAAAFHTLHESQFAHADTNVTPEVVTMRLRATGLLAKPERVHTGSDSAASSNGTTRRVVLPDGAMQVPVLTHAELPVDGADGPLLVEASRTTLFIPAGWRIAPDAGHCLQAELLSARA